MTGSDTSHPFLLSSPQGALSQSCTSLLSLLWAVNYIRRVFILLPSLRVWSR